MGIAGNEWGFQVGKLPKGALDKISDVPGVTVGHCTLADGVVQTGVTALLPHPGDIFHEKVLAASHVINGFGKTSVLCRSTSLARWKRLFCLPIPSVWAQRRPRW